MHTSAGVSRSLEWIIRWLVFALNFHARMKVGLDPRRGAGRGKKKKRKKENGIKRKDRTRNKKVHRKCENEGVSRFEARYRLVSFPRRWKRERERENWPSFRRAIRVEVRVRRR